MATKDKIAGILFKGVKGGKFSFCAAAKIYGQLDLLISRSLSRSSKYTHKKIVEHLIKATNPKSAMCWTSIGFPAELLQPFGIYPLTMEVIGGVLTSLGVAQTFINRADALDVPPAMCSFHRVLLGLSDTNFFGKPSFVGATSILCDGNLKSFSVAARNQDVTFKFIDVPYELSDEAVYYVKGQLGELIAFLEGLTSVRFDYGNYRGVVRNINEAFGLSRRFYELRSKSRKNLYQAHEVANFAFPMHFLLGSGVLVDILKERCEDVESGRVFNRTYKKAEFSRSARRLMWLHIVPQYDSEMWEIIDNGETARIVCDEYSAPYYEDYDPRDPLASIARRLISHPANGPIERRIEHILNIARDYNVEGIIHYSSWGCHQASGNVQLLGERLQDAGYKFLNLNSDPVDQRNVSSEQHRTRLEAFLEN